MMREAGQLLGDVALLDHDHRLLRDPVRVDIDAGRGGDLLHALLVVRQHLVANLVAMIGQSLLQIANRMQARQNVVT